MTENRGEQHKSFYETISFSRFLQLLISNLNFLLGIRSIFFVLFQIKELFNFLNSISKNNYCIYWKKLNLQIHVTRILTAKVNLMSPMGAFLGPWLCILDWYCIAFSNSYAPFSEIWFPKNDKTNLNKGQKKPTSSIRQGVEIAHFTVPESSIETNSGLFKTSHCYSHYLFPTKSIS